MPDLPKIHRAGLVSVPRHKDELDRREAVARAARNQAKRMYKTSDVTWRRMRARVLAEEPLCRACQESGRVKAANEVDHIDGDSFNNSRDNLQALCKPCHSRKTMRDWRSEDKPNL